MASFRSSASSFPFSNVVRASEDPLALAYCVDNEDGSRTELNRVTLSAVLERILDDGGSSPADSARLRLMAGELRALAQTLEQHAQSLRA